MGHQVARALPQAKVLLAVLSNATVPFTKDEGDKNVREGRRGKMRERWRKRGIVSKCGRGKSASGNERLREERKEGKRHDSGQWEEGACSYQFERFEGSSSLLSTQKPHTRQTRGLMRPIWRNALKENHICAEDMETNSHGKIQLVNVFCNYLYESRKKFHLKLQRVYEPLTLLFSFLY